VTERSKLEIADPVTAPFWQAAERRVLVVQRCHACGSTQHYPRGFCINCYGLDLGWIEASGKAVVHAVVTVRIPVTPELEPPYQLALVDLQEGVRMLTNIVGEDAAIDDSVALEWRERTDGPPLPVFRRV
jgi:uncharacterized OB-fold protein